MCGIAGVVSLSNAPIQEPEKVASILDRLMKHRGPDGAGQWINSQRTVVLVHRRLAVIDSTPAAHQPMHGNNLTTLVYNGEIYNHIELRDRERQFGYQFKSRSDSETILAIHSRLGVSALQELRGMFAYALWDESRNHLTLVRDRFGIKPLYFAVSGEFLYFASEIKALLPFVPSISTNSSALAEYLTFQFTISGQTLFDGVKEIPPGQYVTVKDGVVTENRYWDVQYNIAFDKPAEYFETRLTELLNDSIKVHLRSDVEVGAYVSGGLDSSLIYGIASAHLGRGLIGFHGRFGGYPGFDESQYAQDVVNTRGGTLSTRDITSSDFITHIADVIYHLDQPVAGPGSFAQFMVSELASRHVKVVLGGQGGDEIFGGYARYLIAYFEQCIRAAIDGTYRNGSYVVTLESIIPNLGTLQEYKPLIQEFWRDGLFGPLDQRFLRLIDRSSDMKEEIDWTQLNTSAVYERFFGIFNSRRNVGKEAYFDSMTHFDFKTLLPALLHVEDRMSMAHGLESRVPFLDHPLVEFAATIPADVKFKDGQLKHLLKSTFRKELPTGVISRRDKMGFPVPLTPWFANELKDFFFDTVATMETKSRQGMNASAIRKNFQRTGKFSRKTWALLSLELWHEQFHDRASEFRAFLKG